jgi:hypothetical protein
MEESRAVRSRYRDHFTGCYRCQACGSLRGAARRARNHAFFHFLGPGFRAGEHDSDLPCRIQHKAYTKPENLCSDEFMDDMRQIEHRRSRRVGMKQALLVRPLDPKDGSFEELGTTKNVSQGGVYFVTQRKVYYEGMRLSVTVPYSATGTQNYEYRGRVTRVEELGNSQRGVAIRFVSSAAMKSSKF